MLRNYLTLALRNLRKRKGYAIINVFGLAVGLACCVLIWLFVQDERSFDRQHPDAERLYRITNAIAASDDVLDVAITPAIYGPTLAEAYPEVEAFTRFHPGLGALLIERGAQRDFENTQRFAYADANFFDFFAFPLAQGDAATALAEPLTVVLTPSIARKYFGDEDPMGQTLRANGVTDFRVTGVLAEEPTRTHFQFDALFSFASLHHIDGQYYGADGVFFTSWHLAATHSYLRLAPGANPDAFAAKFPAFIAAHLPEQFHSRYRPALQAVPDIHLRSTVQFDVANIGSAAFVYLFAAIGGFILLLACINFMNLATARSAERAREVGVRKALGARRGQLIRQFLSESVLMAGLAVVFAFALMQMVLPWFNELTGKAWTLADLVTPAVWGSLLAVALGVGVLAGSYPALILSRFNAVRVLKGTFARRSHHGGLRRGLVVLQFTISMALLAGTGIVYQQLDYLRSADLGFDQEHVVTVSLPDEAVQAQYETIKAAFRQSPNVVSVAAASSLPGMGLSKHDVRPEGIPDDERWLMGPYLVDFDFIETLDLDLVEGRAFSPDFSTDSTAAYILNEAAVERLGWTGSAVGREFTWANPRSGGEAGQVIGVVKNFHFQGLQTAVEPAMLRVSPEWFGLLAVRVRPHDLPETLAFLEAQWDALVPQYPFSHAFLDENFSQQYATEERLGDLATTFTLLALLIACLGLFGLASYTAEQRTKEIGVRKVLGASVGNLVGLLTREFVLLVGVGFVLATPIAYVGLSHWLDGFAYRIDLGLAVFLLAGVLALAIAFGTVAYQALRAALANPVEALRYE